MAVDLFVHARDPRGNTIDAVIVSWRLNQGTENRGTLDATNGHLRLDNVPDDREFIVKLERPNAPAIEVLLNLSLRGDRKFVRGRPTVMRLVQQRGQLRGSRSRSRYLLTITLHEPQEVVLCAGADTHHRRRSPFVPIALRRFARMVRSRRRGSSSGGVVRVNPSCVLTLFEFNGDQSARHHLLPGRGMRDLPGDAHRAGVVLMSSIRPPMPEELGGRGIVGVYAYLAQAGRLRPGTVQAFELMSHAYWIGPVLENTSRAGKAVNCFQSCPTHGEHGAVVFDLPKQLPLVVYYPSRENEEGVLHLISRCLLSVRDRATPPITMPHVSRVHNDLDPRNTDFVVLRHENVENMKKALSPECVLRVWGCSNGDMGPRWRMVASRGHDRGAENTLVTVRSSYHPGGARIPQEWKLRRGDIRLLYLSEARRAYAQAIADALERPCYAAGPGTWSDYVATPTLGGMEVNPGMVRVMRGFARRYLGLSRADEDEAGYFRFRPNPPRQPANIKVLVTGFAPFGGETANASTDAVSALRESDVRRNINVPPWLDLDLSLLTEVNVDVVWTCPAARAEPVQPVRRNHPPLRGAEGILRRAQQIDAAIVVIVGESGRLGRSLTHVRVEQFANNTGRSALEDNDGNMLAQDGEIFPGQKATLESVVPRITWARMVHNLLKDGFGVHIPDVAAAQVTHEQNGETLLRENLAGEFICNESFYRLLLESKVGDQRADPSGRWVTALHVGAFRDAFSVAQLGRVLTRVVATLVEDMLWATEIYGRQGRLRV
jgi:pyrrolidone-carboxylate peptidase